MDTLNVTTTNQAQKTSRVLKWILVVGIVVVLNLFFNFAIKLVYEEPLWDKFCPQKQVTIQPDTQEKCVAEGGAWTENTEFVPMKPSQLPVSVSEPRQVGYCDLQFTCRQKFEDASELYNRNVFIILVILGVIALVAGFFLTTVPAVSLGLSLGGVLSFIIASIRYWSQMDEYLRVIVLGLALVALIWLGVKKIKE